MTTGQEATTTKSETGPMAKQTKGATTTGQEATTTE